MENLDRWYHSVGNPKSSRMNMKNDSSVNETYYSLTWVVLGDIDCNHVIEKASYRFNNINGQFGQMVPLFWKS